MKKRYFLALALLAAPAVPCRAQVVLSGISWHWRPELRGFPGRFGKPAPIEIVDAAGPALRGRLGASIFLLNRGGSGQEGILLRYAFSMKIAPRGRPNAAAWAVPFVTDEYRIPRLVAGKTKEAPLDPVVLSVVFRSLYRAGFIVEAVRVQVMVEPRPGDTGPLEIRQDEIEAKS